MSADIDTDRSEMTLRVWLNDGSVHDIDIDNPAQVNYEIQARREQWPDPSDGGPLLWLTNLAFWQLSEIGLVAKASTEQKAWERFRNTDLRKVRQIRAPGLAEVPPTLEAPASAPSLPSASQPAGPLTVSTPPPPPS